MIFSRRCCRWWCLFIHIPWWHYHSTWAFSHYAFLSLFSLRHTHLYYEEKRRFSAFFITFSYYAWWLLISFSPFAAATHCRYYRRERYFHNIFAVERRFHAILRKRMRDARETFSSMPIRLAMPSPHRDTPARFAALFSHYFRRHIFTILIYYSFSCLSLRLSQPCGHTRLFSRW